MTDSCVTVRGHLAAIADWEVSDVSAESLAHAQTCKPCAAEVDLHALLGEKLRTALRPVDGAMPHGRPSRRLVRLSLAGAALAATAAAALLVIPGVIGSSGTGGDDRAIQLAVTVAKQSPILRSADTRSVSTWCVEHGAAAAPPVGAVDGTLLGARSDAGPDASVVTVYYHLHSGGASVSWLDEHSPSTTPIGITARRQDGRLVLVVSAPDGLAVVTGEATDADLWTAAVSLELDHQDVNAVPAAALLEGEQV